MSEKKAAVKKAGSPKVEAKGKTPKAKNCPPFAEGDCFAIPVGDLGFCPVVVTRAPGPDAETDFAFVYINLELSKKLPEAADIPPLAKWKKAWLGLLTTLPFRNGRWTSIGSLAEFDRDTWVLPPSRASAVDESEPVEEWHACAWGEMWAIETTPDEPVMTLVANTPADRKEALGYPRTGVFTAASAVEKALVNYFKSRSGGYFDAEINVTEISQASLELWRNSVAKIRAKHPLPTSGWLPAGKTTDKNLKAGMGLALPLQGGGFGAALLIEKPERHLRIFADAIVMTVHRRWDRWPMLDDLRDLKQEDGSYVAQTSMVCIRDGRWRVIGEHPGFDKDAWTWPYPFWQSETDKARGVIHVTVAKDTFIEVAIDPNLLAAEPEAGGHMRGSSGYGRIELEVARILNGTRTIPDPGPHWEHNIVTPARLMAWQKINAVIRDAIAHHSASKK